MAAHSTLGRGSKHWFVRLLPCVLLFAVSAAAAVTDLERIHLTDVRLSGAQIVDPTEAEAIIAPYRNTDITFEDLMVLRQKLTEALVSHGYVNSGVVVPDQRIDDGVVEMRVVAGTLTAIEVNSDASISDARITTIVDAGVAEPFNVNDLVATVERLQRDPLIARVNAYLAPGAVPGQGILSLDVRGAPKRTLQLAANNYSPPGIDENQGSFVLSDASLTGHGDELSIGIDATDGSTDYYVAYTWPFAGGTSLSAYAWDKDLKIVERPFDELDIRTNTDAWGVEYTWPVIDAASRALSVFIGFEYERSETRVLGVPFSFSPGEENGKSKTSAVSLGAEWAERIGANRFALRSSVTQGVDAFHATEHSGNLPDTDFTLFISQGQYLRELTWLRAIASARFTLQLTNNPLLPQLKLPIGGRYSVRGYRENQLVRDNGLASSLELRIPLDAAAKWTFIPFCDYGRSWDENQNLPTANAKIIYSVGAGMTWTPVEGLNAEVYYGDSLKDVDNATETNQDRGWNYQVTYEYRF